MHQKDIVSQPEEVIPVNISLCKAAKETLENGVNYV